MEDKYKNIEYVVGIDLGHGETSAAICAMAPQQGQAEPVKDIPMPGNRKVIASAITITTDGDAVIGDQAFREEVLRNSSATYVCFKKQPENIDGEAEQIMTRYMQEVYHVIRDVMSAQLTDDNHVVAIATPSGWPKEAAEMYREMAQRAGIPIEFVTKESRAAFIKANHDATSGLSKNTERGCIVFDMGSSTLDFTYLSSDLGNRPIDFGYDCGASFVEKYMFHKLKENDPAIDKFVNKYPQMEATLLYETRKSKESIYFQPTMNHKHTIIFEDLVPDDEEFEDDRIRIKYAPGELDQYLEEAGYINQIRNAMIDFVNHHINGRPIYSVLLTGGASRMDFIKRLVEECWGVPADCIYRDTDPSLTISEGVAEVGRLDIQSNGKDAGIAESFDRLRDGSVICNGVKELFANELTTYLQNTLDWTICNWRDSENNSSIEILEQNIDSNIQATVAQVSGSFPQIMQQVVDSETQGLREQVNDLIRNYSANGKVDFALPELNVTNNIQLGNLDMEDIISTISAQIAKEAKWSSAIIGASIGMILAGPIGAAIVGWASNRFFGRKSDEERRDQARKKLLEKEQRVKVVQTLAQKWDDICNSIQQTVEMSVNNNEDIANDVPVIASNLITAYEKGLAQARMMIDD